MLLVHVAVLRPFLWKSLLNAEHNHFKQIYAFHLSFTSLLQQK